MKRKKLQKKEIEEEISILENEIKELILKKEETDKKLEETKKRNWVTMTNIYEVDLKIYNGMINRRKKKITKLKKELE